MKNKSLYITSFAIIIIITSIAQLSIAQTAATDKLIMLSGEEKIGQVTEVGDTFIKFIHKGETLNYSFKKSDINKIQFASGRIEFFTQSPKEGKDSLSTGMQDHHNVVAILPFSYIGSGGSRDEKMSVKAQGDCFNILKKEASQLIVQDPIITNALLVKGGINESNIVGFTPNDLAQLLGAEYVIYCTITINQRGSTTTGTNYFNAKNNGNRTSGFGLGSSSSTANFNTNVDMKIYTDQGQNVFAQSHNSFWPNENAYETTLKYLIKRTPLHHK
ncbi:MAG: hypothetical protein ACK5TU_06605 [Cyclobacteriaceae bacterium]